MYRKAPDIENDAHNGTCNMLYDFANQMGHAEYRMIQSLKESIVARMMLNSIRGSIF